MRVSFFSRFSFLTLLLQQLLLLQQAVASKRHMLRGPEILCSYDLSYTNGLNATDRFEHVHIVASLGGIVNRERPALFTPLLVDNGAVDQGSNADEMWRQHLVQR